MYRVISMETTDNYNEGDQIAILEKVNYIKLKNGIYINATSAEADGISIAGTVYNLKGHDSIGGGLSVVISEFDAGSLLAECSTKIDELTQNS